MDSRAPSLADLLRDSAKLEGLPREAIPALRGELAALDTCLLARLLGQDGHPQDVEDQRLTVAEAAGRLGVSEDYLYHHHKRLPFTRREGRKLLFSAQGIAQHISQKKQL